jgi:hypothetical protein
VNYLVSYLLASTGLTILIVWPRDGPGAWVRERMLRRLLPEAARAVLDCYICMSVWTGAILSPVWWCLCQERWTWFGCLMTPAVFWIVLRMPKSDDDEE